MVSLEVRLSKYDIQYILRGSIKSQVLENFLIKFCFLVDKEATSEWTLPVDEAYNVKGSGIIIVLEGPNVILIEQALKYKFRASNYQKDYEALIVGMILSLEMVPIS